jgi:hypothetical protein
MDEDERQSYRRLYEATVRQIGSTEEFAKLLTTAPDGSVKANMQETTHQHLRLLQDEAEELEQLGWDNGSA